jgi:LacI family transcriptional regulator
LIRLLFGKQVDGVVICPAYYTGGNPNLDLFQYYGMPYVLINRAPQTQQHPCIQAHNFQGAYLAGKYLIQHGHTQVIHLTRKYSISAVEDRLAGFKKAFSEHQIPFPEHHIYRCCEVSMESAYTETLNILKAKRDFTAIFAFNDIIAFGIMKAIYECHIKIPREIAIMGFDNLLFSDICLVPLTTVNQNLQAIGAIAIDVLLKQIQGEPANHIPQLPEPYIVERESV